MHKATEIMAGDEPVLLLPTRAVWWPRGSTLIVADLHLGKEQAFGASGIAVPAGLMQEALARLGACVEAHGARRVIVVGDLLHARLGLTPAVVERVAEWRDALGADLWLAPGNHDAAIDRVAAHWRLRVCDTDFREGPFRFVHAPDEGRPDCFTWAGHVHPAVRLEAGADALRLPCYRIGPRVGVLPAFSLFTGGSLAEVPGADRAWAIAGDRVIAVPAAAPARR